MQAKAIISAACELANEKIKVIPEIMIPLVGNVNELKNQRALVVRVAEETMKEYGVKIQHLVGTMNEAPGAAVTAQEIAEVAEFFPFVTNHPTQMTLRFSRDDGGHFIYTDIHAKVFQD